uniref:Uncharacterized protein n=1 Tax=Branchiostoma floridae TaxID=7739 RepID=C3ZSZ8_BRAFL|eukprot:XP_002588332.1 hypothetical protein BRAFLDRAFT_122894 [Branchiostoma floridae]
MTKQLPLTRLQFKLALCQNTHVERCPTAAVNGMAETDANKLLLSAAAKGWIGGVKRALEAGKSDNVLYSPTLLSKERCGTGQLELVRLLLRKGASLVKRTMGAKAPLHAAAMNGSDQQSGDEDDQDEASVPKTLVPPRERRPAVNPDVSSDSEEERTSTSHAADVPRPRRHRRRPSYLEDFALDSDSDYIDLT